MPRNDQNTALATCRAPAFLRVVCCSSLSATGLSPGLRTRSFHPKEGVRQSDRMHIGRQPRLDYEHDGHLSRLVGLQLLTREAEALHLLEIAAGDLRSITRNRLAERTAVGIVLHFV